VKTFLFTLWTDRPLAEAYEEPESRLPLSLSPRVNRPRIAAAQGRRVWLWLGCCTGSTF
jgi:hypothetical protein